MRVDSSTSVAHAIRHSRFRTELAVRRVRWPRWSTRQPKQHSCRGDVRHRWVKRFRRCDTPANHLEARDVASGGGGSIPVPGHEPTCGSATAARKAGGSSSTAGDREKSNQTLPLGQEASPPGQAQAKRDEETTPTANQRRLIAQGLGRSVGNLTRSTRSYHPDQWITNSPRSTTDSGSSPMTCHRCTR